MSYLLFLDESGQDRRASPYEVLAGIAVRDEVLWALIKDINDSQIFHFGVQLFQAYGSEAKAKKLLKTKVFRHAAQLAPIEHNKRRKLSKQILEDGENPTREQLTALGQAKIAYCEHVISICNSFGCEAFASIIPNDIERPKQGLLRKDYSYLFERFYHFLNRQPDKTMGIVVFDENDKRLSQLIVDQMAEYFLHPGKGMIRSRLIIPEPLFVHSDLTTLIQMADLIAYIVSWGVRLSGMIQPAREELDSLAKAAVALRYHAPTSKGYDTWGFKLIKDLNLSEKKHK